MLGKLPLPVWERCLALLVGRRHGQNRTLQEISGKATYARRDHHLALRCTTRLHVRLSPERRKKKKEGSTLIPRTYNTIYDKEKGGEGEIKIHHHDGLALGHPRRPWHRLGRSRRAAQQRNL